MVRMAGINVSLERKGVLRGISRDWLYIDMTTHTRPVSSLVFFLWMVAAHAGGTFLAVASALPVHAIFDNPSVRLLIFGGSLFTICLAADVLLQGALLKRAGHYAEGAYSHRVSLWQAGLSVLWTLASLSLATPYFSAGATQTPRLVLLPLVLFVVGGVGYVSTLLALWVSRVVHKSLFKKEAGQANNP